MATQAPRVADMTVEQLKKMIQDEIVAYHRQPRQIDPTRAAAFHNWIRANRPKQKPGTPSVVETIRQDRDRDHR